jgi:hypothetical protein
MEVSDGLRRSRLTVFFRLALAFPHLVWLALWGILVAPLAIFNWVVTLILGTTPGWLHRFFSRYVRYQLHVSAFLYLVGNPFPGFAGAAGSYPIELHLAGRERQNRWRVGFRLILAFPALLLASVFSQLLFVVAVFGWFVGLFTARMPLGLRNLGAFALRYTAQTSAYLLLLAEAYPYSGPCVEAAPAPPAPGPVSGPGRRTPSGPRPRCRPSTSPSSIRTASSATRSSTAARPTSASWRSRACSRRRRRSPSSSSTRAAATGWSASRRRAGSGPGCCWRCSASPSSG